MRQNSPSAATITGSNNLRRNVRILNVGKTRRMLERRVVSDYGNSAAVGGI